ncbi:low affinity cationic amino acid transporter isoform 1 [Schistosoma japonicum]|uniref:Low affinity cationic amino acid transporter isoform 1 n=1 Tax=Schistosoma japonicum TaxID=6182 RepID=A0A4Z2D4W9_SCHJA|nr:low affinity cationic amino acid transporter isoform 1 [Schistosoma japonicum]
MLAFAILLCIVGILNESSSMECYVCRNQEGNKDKCIKTTMQCLEDEHSCITNISYTVPPYWSPMGERTHFLWKACISTEECERQKEIAGKTCQREWYMDWRCVECCQGELCNYYATLSSYRVYLNKNLMILITFPLIVYQLFELFN